MEEPGIKRESGTQSAESASSIFIPGATMQQILAWAQDTQWVRDSEDQYILNLTVQSILD
jgi:hypothetical protein